MDQAAPPHHRPGPLLPGWTDNPIPNFSLSASGLIMLADLSTVAHRTALRGGSSWLDFLLLVPGLHYQQAADELVNGGAAVLQAVESGADAGADGSPVVHSIVNRAVVGYIVRQAVEGRTVVLDVGEIPVRSRGWRVGTRGGSMYGRGGGPAGAGAGAGPPDLGWAAHLLYLASPVLTVVAATLIILLGDWWALGLLVALMISRLLNIFVIKQRSGRPRPRGTHLPPPFSQPPAPAPGPKATGGEGLAAAAAAADRITRYTVAVDASTRVVLRGTAADLLALTTTVWLRPKTHAEGYLEAAAKVLVYLVAACSENATQAGNAVLLGLVLASAGLLALSNAQTRGLRSGGRMVSPSAGEPLPPGGDGGGGGGGGRGGGHAGGRRRGGGGGDGGGVVVVAHGDVTRRNARRGAVESWPGGGDLGGLGASEGSADKDLEGGLTRRSRVGEDQLGYPVRLDPRLGRLEVIAQRAREQGDRGMV